MNLYELAKTAMSEKTQWSTDDRVVIFENTTHKVYLSRTQHGKITMQVMDKVGTSSDLINKYLDLGYVGKFSCTQSQYALWSKQVKRMM